MANDKKNRVSIIIDKTQHHSPTPTTGAALYVLGNVQDGFELFRDTPGKGDDEPIANDTTEVVLKPGDRFYSTQTDLNPGA